MRRDCWLCGRQLIRPLVVALLFAPIVAGELKASPRWEGSPTYGFSMFVRDSIVAGKPFDILCTVYGGTPEFSSEDSARITLRIPSSMELIAGDTTKVCCVLGMDCGWATTVRLSDADVQHVVGEMVIAYRDTIRERATIVLEIGLGSASPALSQVEQMVTYRNGRAYRYGGVYLVPTDGPGWSQTIVASEGTKARILKSTEIRYGAAAMSRPDDALSFDVLVDEGGKAVDVRAIGGMSDAALLGAARSVIMREWTFAPTQVRGKAISDWLRVNVKVRK